MSPVETLVTENTEGTVKKKAPRVRETERQRERHRGKQRWWDYR